MPSLPKTNHLYFQLSEIPVNWVQFYKEVITVSTPLLPNWYESPYGNTKQGII